MSVIQKSKKFLNRAFNHNRFFSRSGQWNEIRYYTMFISFPRSGHTLAGALLNAHPRILVSHEFHALRLVLEGESREKIFSELVRRDRWFQEKQKASWQGYEYGLEGFHQGKAKSIRVIGDKAGGASVRLLRDHPQTLEKLGQIVNVPLRIIHYVRNPFDNIATIHLRSGKRTLDDHIANYFRRTEVIRKQVSMLDDGQVARVWHEEFCTDAKANIRKLVEFLGEESDAGFEEACRNAVFEKPKITRNSVEWTSEQIALVEERCRTYSFLADYSFART